MPVNALLSMRAGLGAGEPWLVAVGVASATLPASAGGVATVFVEGTA
jgi:hypothetical protein